MEQNENTLSVLKIAPGQYPQQVEIDNELKALQQAVGGSIGASYPFEDPVAIVYNDDGKLMGLPLNRALWDEDGLMYDVIAGTFLVVGLGEEDFVFSTTTPTWISITVSSVLTSNSLASSSKSWGFTFAVDVEPFSMVLIVIVPAGVTVRIIVAPEKTMVSTIFSPSIR